MYYIGGRYAHSFKGVGYSNVGSWLTSVVVISFRKFGTESIGTAMLDDGPYFKILVEESSGRGCRSGADAAMHVQLPISILKQKFYFFFFLFNFLKKINQKILFILLYYSLFIIHFHSYFFYYQLYYYYYFASTSFISSSNYSLSIA